LWFRKYIYNQGVDTFKLNDAYLRVADGYFMLKEYDNAIEFYSKAEQVGAFDADYALFQRAVCEGIKKQFKAKSATLEKLIAENPGSSYLDAAYYELGRAYNIEGDNKQALASFQKIIDHGNKNVYLKKSLIQSGLIHYNDNNYSEATAIFTRIILDYPTYQDTKEALVVLKNIYIEKGEVEKYAELVAGLDFVNVSQGELDSAVFEAAELSYMESNCEKAAPSLKNYLHKFPKAISALKANYYLADCYNRSEQYDSAVVYYQAIAQMPLNSYSEEACLKVADFKFNKADYHGAYTYFTLLETGATSAPNLRHAAGGKLESAFLLDSSETALQAAETYLGHGFTETNYLAMAYLLKGRKAVADSDYPKAIEYFTIVSDTVNSELSAEAIYGLAKIHFEQDSLADSETRVFELVNQVPSYGYWVAKSLILLSDIYVKKDDFFQAKAVLNTVISNYDGEDLKQVANSKLSDIESLEEQEDEQQQPAPDMEIEFEGGDLDTDEIDALFEEEEIEEMEIIDNQTQQEGGSDEK
jgi:TolA-binding protein